MTARLLVRVIPRAHHDAIDGVDDQGRLRVRVTVPPVAGAANEALVRLLAGALDVSRHDVSIESGATSRSKRVRVEGIATDVLTARWPGLSTS